MRSRTSVSEIGLGEWPGISQNGRRQARLAARMRAHHPMHHGWARRTKKILDVDSLF